jgi:putative hydrolase of the HAD superfamily
MEKKWLILDAMGVIFTLGYDLYETLISFVRSKNMNIPDKLIIDTYMKGSDGKFPSSKLWEEIGFGHQFPEIEKEYLDTKLTIDDEFLEVAPDFKKNYHLALLSNDMKEWSDYLRNKYRLNEIFEEIIISGDVGLRKPDKKIYTLLLDRINAPPEKCVFVDDKLRNLKPASELGINTIRFVREKDKTPFCSEFEVRSFKELKSVLDNFYLK